MEYNYVIFGSDWDLYKQSYSDIYNQDNVRYIAGHVDNKKGLERIKVNQRETNRLDLEKSDFHKNVYEGYLTICKQYSDRIVKINADQKVEDVVQDALKEIKKIL